MQTPRRPEARDIGAAVSESRSWMGAGCSVDSWRPVAERGVSPAVVYLASSALGLGRPADCYHSGAEDGGQARGSGNSSARSGRARVAPGGGLERPLPYRTRRKMCPLDGESGLAAVSLGARPLEEGISLSRLEMAVDSRSDDRGPLGMADEAPAGALSTRVRIRSPPPKAFATNNCGDVESAREPSRRSKGRPHAWPPS